MTKTWNTEQEVKIGRAMAYMATLSDTQEARSAAGQNSETIDTSMWIEAGKRHARRLRAADQHSRRVSQDVTEPDYVTLPDGGIAWSQDVTEEPTK